MLTDAERDKFVAWLDAETAKAEQANIDYTAISDPLTAVRFRIESIAFRMVATRLRAESTQGTPL